MRERAYVEVIRRYNGDKALVKQGDASALLEVALDETVADGAVHVSAAHESTATLGAMFGPITLERT